MCVCLVGDHGGGEGGSVALGAVVGVLEREKRKYVASFEVCFVHVCFTVTVYYVCTELNTGGKGGRINFLF